MNLKSEIQNQIGRLITSLLLILCGILAAFGQALLPTDRLSSISTQTWAKTALILFATILALVIYLVFDKRLKLKYGLYWDRKKNPRCPSCKKPLQVYNYCTYHCLACDKNVFASDGSRGYLPIDIIHRLFAGEKVADEDIEKIHDDHTPKSPPVKGGSWLP
jgi:hypothetical protein